MASDTELDSDRYNGRPLLIILENYVLAAIRQLSSERQRGVCDVVKRIFGGGEDWMATVRDSLKLNDSIDESLRGMWSSNQELARQNDVHLDPSVFARMVVDQNFANLIDPR